MDFNVTSRVERRGVLAGLLLGRSRRNGDNFFIQHAPQYYDYLAFKQRLLAAIAAQPLTIYECRTPQGRRLWRLQPPAMPLTRVLIQRLYRGRRRAIERSFLDLLTPLGLAIWFLDCGCRTWKKRADGSVRALEVVFKVDCSRPEATAIATYLQDTGGWRWGLLRSRRGYRLRAGSQVGRAFLETIVPWVPVCMLDKVSPSYNTTATT